MILTSDVGNTQTVLGLFDGETLVEHWRLATDRNRTCDEFAILVRRLLKDSGHPADQVSAVALSSVVPSLHRTLHGGMRKVFGIDAAYTLIGGACLVIDFGTATNFDLVGDDGAFLGGAIAPEMQLAARALTERAAQLHAFALDAPDSVVGKTTSENLQAGIVLGFLDLVGGLIGRFRREVPQIRRVLATGGKAELFADRLDSVDEYVPFLTLRGLKVWWDRSGA